MKIKPAGKAIIIFVIVASIGYGLHQFVDFKKLKVAEVVPDPVIVMPKREVPTPAPVAAPTPTPVPELPVIPKESVDQSANTGLNQLLKQGATR